MSAPKTRREISRQDDIAPRFHLRGLGQGLWVALDQAIFGVANWVIALLLARWLQPEDFGAFVTVLSVFFLIITFYTALLIEPMLIFGPKRHPNRFIQYIAALWLGHWAFCLTTGTVCLFVGGMLLAYGWTSYGWTFLTLPWVMPFLLQVQLVRRATYAISKPHCAALGSLLQFSLTLVAFLYVHKTFGISGAAALAVMGMSGLITVAVLMWHLRIPWRGSEVSAFRKQVIADHWRYGRWALCTSPLQWIPGNYFYLALPILLGTAAPGVMRAVTNLTNPLIQIHSAIRLLLIPSMARRLEPLHFHRFVFEIGGILVCLAMLYYAALLAFGQPIIKWLYGGLYFEYVHLLVPLGLIPITTAVSGVLGSSLRACERPDCEFWSYGAASVISLVIGPLMIHWWGLTGAAWAFVMAYLVLIAAKTFFYIRVVPKVLQEPPAVTSAME